MLIVLVNTYLDAKKGGGAATSTIELSKLLSNEGHIVKLISNESIKNKEVDKIRIEKKGSIETSIYNSNKGKVLDLINNYNPDLTIIGAFDRGVLSYADLLMIRSPIMCVIHDTSILTGGCLFNGGKGSENFKVHKFYKHYCNQYLINECNDCELIVNKKKRNIIQFNFNVKKLIFEIRKDIILLPVSSWMEENLSTSPITKALRIEKMFNPINTGIYTQKSKDISKVHFNLDKKVRYILLPVKSKDDYRKGYFLLEKLLLNYRLPENVEIIIFSKNDKVRESIGSYNNYINYLGFVSDIEEKVFAYNAVEMVLVPSLQDNLPMVCLEALSCGKPIVTFDAGGLSDCVKHMNTGYLAKPFEVEDIKKGIYWVFEKKDDEYKNLIERCRNFAVDNFSYSAVYKRFSHIIKIVPPSNITNTTKNKTLSNVINQSKLLTLNENTNLYFIKNEKIPCVPILKDIKTQLREKSDIAIYGTSETAQLTYAKIRDSSNDIHVVQFLDSFKKGTLFGINIVSCKKIKKVEYIIIASSSVEEICNNLFKNGIYPSCNLTLLVATKDTI